MLCTSLSYYGKKINQTLSYAAQTQYTIPAILNVTAFYKQVCNTVGLLIGIDQVLLHHLTPEVFKVRDMASNGDSDPAVDRKILAETLDKELEEFIKSRPKTEYKDGFSENNWEQEMQLHPAFRTDAIKEGETLPPLVEAMQQLKYDPDENTPEELARSYKEDGNFNFRLKKYRWAIDAYSEGIKQQCNNAELITQLYTNRAAAHYHLGNCRASISDCRAAIKFKSDHIKAIIRAAKCCEELHNYEEGREWCDMGFQIDPKNDDLKKINCTLEKQKKIMDRDTRKNRLASSKLEKEEENLIRAIKAKGIRIAGPNGRPEISLSSVEPCHPCAVGTKVYLNEMGHLIWPVIFLYPEYGQTDFIQAFNENDSFALHLETMFGHSSEVERPSWDLDTKYIPKELKIFFEEKKTNVLWEVDAEQSLGHVLRHQCYTVYGGTPAFIITARSTAFHQQFLKNYGVKKVE